MKVLIIGRHETLYETARHIAEVSSHDIGAVVTASARPEYRRREEDFETLARSCGAEFYVTNRIDDRVFELCASSNVDIGISVNWVSVIPQKFLNCVRHGILNAHFGDLPRYRGNAVTNWGILMGEESLTLTVHRMAEGLDEGDILLKKRMSLSEHTTIADINRFSERNLPGMFTEAIDGLADGSIKPARQANTGRIPFRCYPRLPRDGKIDWSRSAKDIHALVRSLVKPYSGAYTYYRDGDDRLQKLYVWDTRVVEPDTRDIGVPGHVVRNDRRSGESWIYTGRGILAVKSVSHGEHGTPFEPGCCWRSIRMRLGMDVEEELFRLSL